jgi:putative ABC transport system permease protein
MVLFSRSLREASRTLFRKPGVTVLAIASLALAIGFSTAAFSILDAYALRELAVREPARLVSIDSVTREGRGEVMTWPEYQAIAGAHAFEGVIAENRRGPRVRLPDRDDFPITVGVSANYFDLLGVSAQMGRVFHPGDLDCVVVSYRYWHDQLKGDAAMIGRTLLVGLGTLRIAGVLPPDFAGTIRGLSLDVYVPMETWFSPMQMAAAKDVRRIDYDLIGRLRPGVGPAQAQAEVDGILRQMEREGTAPAPERKSKIEYFTEKDLVTKIKSNAVMLGIVVLLVLIAAANLANLRLVENESRRHEIGVRLALGAGWWDLARGHLAETWILTTAGTGLGLLIASWLIRLAPALFYAGDRARDYHIRLDARTFAFSSGALVIVALIGALIPLTDAWRRKIAPSMVGTRVTGTSRWLAALVIVQMALVTGVTCSAGLLWRSLQNVSAIRPAMDPDRKLLVIFGAWDDRPRVPETAIKIAQTAGVQQVGWARRAMLSKSLGGATVGVQVASQPAMRFHFNQVSPDYFAVTGARIVSGRGLSEADGPQSTPVVMVNETFARRFFDGAAEGRWARIDGKDRQVIGVVEDGPAISLRERIDPYVYFPYAQKPDGEMTWLISTARDPGLAADAVRGTLRKSASDFLILKENTMRELMDAAHSSETLTATVTGSLAGLGLFLAAAGLFGVTMFAVARRTPEFGIRMALGASPGRVAGQVLRQVTLRIAIALPFGWAVAWVGRQSIQKMLYGVTADDPATFIGASAIVTLVATVAALRPALRAAHVDPMTALRHE